MWQRWHSADGATGGRAHTGAPRAVFSRLFGYHPGERHRIGVRVHQRVRCWMAVRGTTQRNSVHLPRCHLPIMAAETDTRLLVGEGTMVDPNRGSADIVLTRLARFNATSKASPAGFCWEALFFSRLTGSSSKAAKLSAPTSDYWASSSSAIASRSSAA